jgi:hypothetical protein
MRSSPCVVLYYYYYIGLLTSLLYGGAHASEIDNVDCEGERNVTEDQDIVAECSSRPGEPCCLHMALQPWAYQLPTGQHVTVFPQTCCWSGPFQILYQNLEESGHGPWLAYQKASPIALASSVQSRPGRG